MPQADIPSPGIFSTALIGTRVSIETAHIADKLRATHSETIAVIGASADSVQNCLDASSANRDTVVGELKAELRRRNRYAVLPELLETAIQTIGLELPTEPVAAPPFVVITGRGPVLRAVFEAGRLIVRIRVFERVEDGSGCYERAGTTLSVDWYDAKTEEGAA